MIKVRSLVKNKKSVLERRTGGTKIIFGIFFVAFAIYSATLLYPLFWMVLNSVREVTDYNIAIATKKAFSLDIVFDFSNYARVATVIGNTRFSYLDMVFNSLWTTTISAFLAIFMSSVCGYCLSKYDFKLKGVLYAIAIVKMILPIVGSDGAALRFYGETGLFNTPWYLILGGLGGLGGMQFLIMYGFFKNVHWAYAEAVFIDGGGHFTAFFKIPLLNIDYFSIVSLYILPITSTIIVHRSILQNIFHLLLKIFQLTNRFQFLSDSKHISFLIYKETFA